MQPARALNRAGTTIIISTHDVEALPELADRIIVISHGAKLGEGASSEVLQDLKLLGTAGLELPAIAKLFSELKALGFVKEIQITMSAGLRELTDLLKKE